MDYLITYLVVAAIFGGLVIYTIGDKKKDYLFVIVAFLAVILWPLTTIALIIENSRRG